MTASQGFLEFLRDQLGAVGDISIRRMFGGAGIYAGGVMFALVADDTLYLKADEASRARFEDEGMSAFSYATRDGRTTIASYRQVPPRLFDDPDEMQAWAGKALEVARRAAAGKPRPRKRAPQRPR